MESKVYIATEKLIKDTKYLYFSYIRGVYSILTDRYHFPNTQETVDEMKLAIAHVYYDGFEPEFDTWEQYQRWEKMCPKTLKGRNK
jgi:hypothetical protein